VSLEGRIAMPKHVVVDGALLRCLAGSAPSVLTVTTPTTPVVNGSLAATTMDHQTGVNIKPFGVCGITGGPCLPVTPAPWMPGETSVVSGHAPTLPHDSILLCSVGSIIKVATPGQMFYFVDTPSAREKQIIAEALLRQAREEYGDAPDSHDGLSFGDFLLPSGWNALFGGFEGYAKWMEKKMGRDAARRMARKFRAGSRRLRGGKMKKFPRGRKAAIERARREATRKARRFAKGARVGSIALDVANAAAELAHGKPKDAAASAVGGIAGTGATAACDAAAGAAAPETGGASAVLIGAGCGVVGGVVGKGAEWATKKVFGMF
jgi:hypothetical protein